MVYHSIKLCKGGDVFAQGMAYMVSISINIAAHHQSTATTECYITALPVNG